MYTADTQRANIPKKKTCVGKGDHIQMTESTTDTTSKKNQNNLPGSWPDPENIWKPNKLGKKVRYLIASMFSSHSIYKIPWTISMVLCPQLGFKYLLLTKWQALGSSNHKTPPRGGNQKGV
ncbi:hypothetical protein TcG_00370, partial [Trypanosoma cruzi]